MNCSALSYTSKPKRVQSDIQLYQTYDDVGSLSEQGITLILWQNHNLDIWKDMYSLNKDRTPISLVFFR